MHEIRRSFSHTKLNSFLSYSVMSRSCEKKTRQNEYLNDRAKAAKQWYERQWHLIKLKFYYIYSKKREYHHFACFYFKSHVSKFYSLLCKSRFQKCVRNFCFSKPTFENRLNTIFCPISNWRTCIDYFTIR